MNNPIKDLTRKEWILWLGSLFLVIVSNVLSMNIDILTLVAACVGITSLVFAAKGNVWAQILMIIFSILYGIISWRFHYWGEMITYGNMVDNHLAKEPCKKRKRSCDPKAQAKAHCVACAFWHNNDNCFLLYFGCAQYA